MKRTYRCLFEQSGTFKNIFKRLGYDAYDYDILNDFGETDNIVDLFGEIEKAYAGGESIFDRFNKDKDYILAFFPCTRFEVQVLLWFRGDNYGQRDWDDLQKLEYDLKLHDELHLFYSLITKLVIVCKKKQIPLVIENPYTEQHYLTRYWCLKPTIIDMDRKRRGDYYKKPTQYWFINCKPEDNFVFKALNESYGHTNIEDTHNKVERSMISKEYAERFIKENIVQVDGGIWTE